jgi:hypothetical protein
MTNALRLLGVLLLMASACPTWAAQRTIYISNESDKDIAELSIASSGTNDWLDVDQGSVLEAGYNFDIQFDDQEFGCVFDFHAQYVDGTETSLSGVDACGSDETFVELYSD